MYWTTALQSCESHVTYRVQHSCFSIFIVLNQSSKSACLSLPMVAAQQMDRGCFVGRSHNALRREVLAGGSHVLGSNVEGPRGMHDFMCHDQPNFILHSCICNPAAPCAPRSCEQSKAAKPTYLQPSHQLMGSATYRLLLYLMVLDFLLPSLLGRQILIIPTIRWCARWPSNSRQAHSPHVNREISSLAAFQQLLSLIVAMLGQF